MYKYCAPQAPRLINKRAVGRLHWFLSLLILYAPQLLADDNAPTDYSFSLEIAEKEHTLFTDQTGFASKSRQLGIRLQEQVTDTIALALRLGQHDTSYFQHPDLTGLIFPGYYGELAYQQTFWSLALKPSATFSYRYEQGEEKDATRQIRMAIDQLEASIAATVEISPRFCLHPVIFWTYVQGQQWANSPDEHTTENFRGTAGTGLGLSADLNTGAGGHVGISYQRGTYNLILIYFTREFARGTLL